MKSINLKIFKAYDIRGLYPEEINNDNFGIIIKAIYSFFVKDLNRDHLSVVLGRDMRVSSPQLFEIAKKTLLNLGADVIDIGLSPTPTVYFATLHYQYDVGIQISASHNPKDYNGIKFVKRDGKKLIKIGKETGMDDIKRIAQEGKFIRSSKRGTVIVKKNVINDEIDYALKLVNPQHIGKLKIVVDAANAMGILPIEAMFKKFPIELVKMNFKLDGNFPAHQPDPLQSKTLVDLQKRVVAEKADLGIAPDGDADRIFFVDEKGKIIPPTLITSLVASEIIKKSSRAKIIVDIRYIENVRKLCAKFNITPLITKVGHAFITQLMNKESADFAGESSGHYFFKETGGAESSIRLIMHVLEVLGRKNKPISKISAELLKSYESGELNFELPLGADSKLILSQIAGEYLEGTTSWLDGLSIDFSNWRFNIRTSNTEPLMRLNVEGNNKDLVYKKVVELKRSILSKGAKVKE
jgi:phosphomannomutase